MAHTEFAHQGRCPRCESEDVEREVIYQTTYNRVSGVVFFCHTCGFTGRTVASDREAWYFLHKEWSSPAVPDETLEEFLAKWPKKVGNPSYGSPEPVGPITPRV